MKQKLFLLLVACFLITAPALADAANPAHADANSEFGSIIVATHTTIAIVVPDNFELSLHAEVRYSGGIFTYIYTITHTANKLDDLQIVNALYDVSALDWGWVGNPPVVAIDPLGPFSNPVILSLFDLTFQFDNFGPGGTLTVFSQSTYAPSLEDFFGFFGSGDGGAFAFGETLAPSLSGGGASFDVPEPSSLLLLSFGLLSGGVLRFSTRRTRG